MLLENTFDSTGNSATEVSEWQGQWIKKTFSEKPMKMWRITFLHTSKEVDFIFNITITLQNCMAEIR